MEPVTKPEYHSEPLTVFTATNDPRCFLFLTPSEIEYIQADGRCQKCGHLGTLHQYNGGGDACVLCGCDGEIHP